MIGTVSETITKEGSLLLISILSGAILMLAYDVIRIARKIIKHGTIIIALEDGIYWLVCACTIFAMLYRENEGLLRWFVLAGIAVGMLIENQCFSPWIIKFFVHVIKVILRYVRKLLNILEKPVKKVGRRGKKIFLFFGKRLKKIGKAIKIGLCKL